MTPSNTSANPRKTQPGLVEACLTDESDYDHRVWPRLAEQIEKNRLRDRKRLKGDAPGRRSEREVD